MESNDQALVERLLSFIRSEVPPPIACGVGLSTDLRKDLRLLEEDAEELLFKLFEEFSIGHGDFDFSRYFPAEGLWLLPRFKKAEAPKPLTLGMLLQAAKDGVWDTRALEGRQE